MNLKQLQAFYLVVKRKSFTRAAEELNVTQPAVTIQVKSLEKSLNLKLIQQVGKRLQLTEAGELFYQYAEKILDLVSEADEKMSDFKKLMKDTLQIGCSQKFPRYCDTRKIFGEQWEASSIATEERKSESKLDLCL